MAAGVEAVAVVAVVAARETQATSLPLILVAAVEETNLVKALQKQATDGRPFGARLIGQWPVNQSIIITIGELPTGASRSGWRQIHRSVATAGLGTLEKLGPDRWLFTPARDEARPVTFHYEISDGKAAISQVARSDFLLAHGDEITGTDGNDVLIGTPLNDLIDAQKGNDTVYGREGNDAIRGGDGTIA